MISRALSLLAASILSASSTVAESGELPSSSRQRAVARNTLSLEERLLIPLSIHTIGPGRRTELRVHNEGPGPVRIRFIAGLQPVPFPSVYEPLVTAGEFQLLEIAQFFVGGTFTTGHPGLLIYVPRAQSGQLRWNHRWLEYPFSSGRLSPGTELPVVRERDFYTRTLQIFPVFFDDRYLTALRIYEVDTRPRASFRVSVFDFDTIAARAGGVEEGGGLIATRTVSTIKPLGFVPGDPPLEPSGLELLDLRGSFPELIGKRKVRIEVEPLDPGTRFWACVTSLHLETHDLFVVTPQ